LNQRELNPWIFLPLRDTFLCRLLMMMMMITNAMSQAVEPLFRIKRAPARLAFATCFAAFLFSMSEIFPNCTPASARRLGANEDHTGVELQSKTDGPRRKTFIPIRDETALPQKSSSDMLGPLESEVFLICQKPAFPKASKWIKSIGHLQRQNAFFHGH
jgi:hypothetical protein